MTRDPSGNFPEGVILLVGNVPDLGVVAVLTIVAQMNRHVHLLAGSGTTLGGLM